MKVLSLFSGIGAFEKALTNLEIPYTTAGFSEIDKYAAKSYCAIHGVSEELNLGDITKIDLEQLPECDLITHGSPCQDFSVAGNQVGGDIGTNTRSSLMWNSVEITTLINTYKVLKKLVMQAIIRYLMLKTTAYHRIGKESSV